MNRPDVLSTDFSQQSRDVKDKLEQFIPWLTKLLESLAKPNASDDSQEVERRAELARLASNQTRLSLED